MQKIIISLKSRDAKKLAEFYGKVFDLFVEDKSASKSIFYSCKDAYGNGVFIEQDNEDTSNVTMNFFMSNSEEKEKLLRNMGVELYYAEHKDSVFCFNDPQGNNLKIYHDKN